MAIKKSNWDKIASDKSLYDRLTETNKRVFWEYGSTQGFLPKQNLSQAASQEMAKYIKPDFYDPKYISKKTQKPDQAEPTYKEPTDKFTKPKPLSLQYKTKPVMTAEQKREVIPSALASASKAFKAKEQDIQARGIETDAQFKAPKATMPPVSRQVRAEEQSKKIQAQAQTRRQETVKNNEAVRAAKESAKQELAKIENTFKQLQQRKISLTPQQVMDLEEKRANLKTIVNPVGLAAVKRGSLGLYDVAMGSAEKKSADKGYFERARQTQEQAMKDPVYKAAALGTDLAVQGGLYAATAPAIQATKFGQALLGGVGSSMARKFAGSQVANLAVDTIIQTPLEAIQAINEDKTLDRFAKDWATNRAIDLVFNGFIEGAVEGSKLLRTLNTPQARTALKQANIEPEMAVKAVMDNDTETINQIRKGFGNKPEVKQPEVGNLYVNPQGGASRELSRAEMPLDVPTGRMALPEPTDTQIPPMRTREVPRTVTPSELTEQRLLDLQNRVRSGQIPQDEAEFVAKRLIEDMRTPRPQETIAQQGIIEPNRSVLPQGNTIPMVDAKMPETPIVGESESGLFRSTMAKNIDSPIRQKLEQAASDFVLPTTSNEARRNMARSIMSDDFESALSHVKSGDKLTNSVEPFLADEVIGELNRLGRYDDISDVIASQAKKARASGQEVQAFSQWARTSPEGIQRWAIRSLEEAGVPKEEIKEVATQLYKEVSDIRTMTTEELAEQIRKQSNLYKNVSADDLMGIATLDNVKQLLTAKSMQKALAKIPTATASKLSTWQAMSHLLNLRTFSRNILGNMASLTGEKVSKVPAKAFDKLLSIGTGRDSISLSYPKFMDEFKEGVGAAKQSALEISLGVNRVNKDKYDLFMGDVFKSKPLKAGEKLLRYSLDTPDAFFKGMTMADAIHTAVKARLGKEADKMTLSQLIEKATLEEIDEAKKYSEFVTFQNDSWLAKFLGDTKTLLNKVGFGPKEARFGLGDITLKYTRVPGNIITRGIEYSPIGYLNTLNKLASLKNISVSDQRKLAMQLGRATTGTGLMTLGMILRNSGVITGEPISDDYDVQAFERAQGKGEYKVNISAIGRILSGGDPSPKKGDRMESYNWVEPFSVPLAVGAKIADKFAKGGEGGFNPLAEIGDISKMISQESFDLPSLYVVQQMAREYAYGSDFQDVAMIPLKEALPGIVTPSIVRQIAQTIDPTVRETRSEFAGGDDVLNKIKANVPFLSKTLPPKLDPLGREQQRTGGAFSTMINPAASSTLNQSDYSDKLNAILGVTGKESLYPERKPPKSFNVKPKGATVSTAITMTPQETQAYQKKFGQEYDRRVSSLLKLPDVQSIKGKKAELLADKILQIKSDAKKAAQSEVIKLRKRNQ